MRMSKRLIALAGGLTIAFVARLHSARQTISPSPPRCLPLFGLRRLYDTTPALAHARTDNGDLRGWSDCADGVAAHGIRNQGPRPFSQQMCS
jgi:hypothetical protein